MVKKLKDIVHQVMGSLSQDKISTQSRITEAWTRINDEKTKQHTEVTGFQKGVLRVSVDSPAWMFELNNRKQVLIKELKYNCTEVKDIRFKIGKVR